MSYFELFFKKEDGVESMEWMAIVCVAAALIGIAASCGKSLVAKLKGIASAI